MDSVIDSAKEIVQRSGSNLAFAFAILPRSIRRDMEIFYAFCRLVDDLVDEAGLEDAQRRQGLDRWRGLITGAITDPTPGIESEFVDLCQRRHLNQEDLLAIIAGMEMDLSPRFFQTKEELRHYCYHVASAVGLVSVTLFGAENPEARAYAIELGYALQWTNILRDIGEDAAQKRLFLPLDDLARFGLNPESIFSMSPDPAKFGRLMKHEVAVARAHYQESLAIINGLPKNDRNALRSAELMRRIYLGILDKMESDGFHNFTKRYRLSKVEMACELLRSKFLPWLR